MENLSTVLRQRRKELGLTLAQIADRMGVAEATVQRWESGNIKSIRYDKIDRLAAILQVSPAAIMGWDSAQPAAPLPSNIIPMPTMKQIPLVGQIACGEPILAEQHIDDYVDLPDHIHADFALRCKGDSMVGAGIEDGDLVYIREQPEVENGQIAAVLLDEEATLKRIYYDGRMMQLIAENPRYPPRVIMGHDLESVRILGMAVAYTRVIV